MDATPANLIGTAFQMMGDTANQEVLKISQKITTIIARPCKFLFKLSFKRVLVIKFECAFQLLRVFTIWQNGELRFWSRTSWLDLWLLAVCFFALAISVTSSVVNVLLYK